jgi:ParB family chromosome partitioning protein
MWAGHNRDYCLAKRSGRCPDLIESVWAQGRQEIPAIVRRLSGEEDFDFRGYLRRPARTLIGRLAG